VGQPWSEDTGTGRRPRDRAEWNFFGRLTTTGRAQLSGTAHPICSLAPCVAICREERDRSVVNCWTCNSDGVTDERGRSIQWPRSTQVSVTTAPGRMSPAVRVISTYMPVLGGHAGSGCLSLAPHAMPALCRWMFFGGAGRSGSPRWSTAANIPGHNDIGPVFSERTRFLAEKIGRLVGAPVCPRNLPSFETFDRGACGGGTGGDCLRRLPPFWESEDGAWQAESYTYLARRPCAGR